MKEGYLKLLGRKTRKLLEAVTHRAEYIDIPIARVRHDTARCYRLEGYGGKKVSEWPIHEFFHEFINGDRMLAMEKWTRWYLEQYRKYGRVSKSKGGMKGGGIDELARLCDSSKDETEGSNSELYRKVRERVNRRFEFAEEIIKVGYIPDRKNPVKGFQDPQGRIILRGGHHRVALMAVLGYETVPDVLVQRQRRRLKLRKSAEFRGG